MTEVPKTAPPPPPPGAASPPPPPAAAAAPAPAPTPTPAAPAADVPAATAPVPVQAAPQAEDISDQTLLIPLSMIDLMDGQQYRLSRDPKKFAETKASIKANGQNDPVKVMKNGSRFFLVYGHGRFRACQELGIGKIRAELFYGNPQEAILLALSENVNREEANPIEVALGCREAIKRGASLQQVATSLGKLTNDGTPDIVWVEQHLDLLGLNETQRKEVANNMMSKTVALNLAKMDNDNRDKVFAEMEKISEGEKKPAKKSSKKSVATDGKAPAAPPPPPLAKKTGTTLEKAKASVSGKSKDKFIGTKAARELFKGIKDLDDQYIPTVEDDIRKEMLAIIDYLLGKRKTKPLQLDVE